MPKRKYTARQKIDSEAVQGEGSYVVMRRPTWEDIEALVGEDGSLDNLTEMQAGKLLIKDLVEEWNWVDDKDEPLAQPSEDIFKTLPIEEIMFLVEQVDVDGLTAKKSKTSPKK
jgi:hypothetical protein